MRMPAPVSAGRLGLVLVVGLLACLLNPFHARAFILPPELASVVQRVAGRVALPEAVFGGGQVLLRSSGPRRTRR